MQWTNIPAQFAGGDVIGLVDMNGAMVVEYRYDASLYYGDDEDDYRNTTLGYDWWDSQMQ